VPDAPDPADKGADQFQPVNRRAGYSNDRLTRLLDYLERWPHATLASGEGRILADEIHRLRGEGCDDNK
jgi:hypothetical protein